jgi:cysteine-rich repeat protein
MTCDDGSFCTFNDVCDGNNGCDGTDVDCDDVNPCTDDTCDSQGGGFLCMHVNNGICIGPNCGNTVVDAGETCDPPNLGTDPQTGQTICRLDCTACGDGVVQANNAETCDDGNTVSGCRPDQPQRPLDECLNNCSRAICDDPARISFKRDFDMLKFHGRLITEQSIDLGSGHFAIELRDVNDNVLYRASLVRGTMEATRPGMFRYKNRLAKASGGLYTFKAKYRENYYIMTLKAYGDLSASVSDMVTHVYSGTNEWAVRGQWKPVGPNAVNGWKLGKGDVFLPVP